MKIIRHRERIESTSYSRSFEYEDMPGAGFGFDCDEHGNVDIDKLPPAARSSWDACMAGETERVVDGEYERDEEGDLSYVPGTGHRVKVKLLDMGVVTHHHSYVQPAVGECACDAHVELRGFTNTCHKCGRDYNTSGQLLAPRSQWGEETGESVSDILTIDGASMDRLFEE